MYSWPISNDGMAPASVGLEAFSGAECSPVAIGHLRFRPPLANVLDRIGRRSLNCLPRLGIWTNHALMPDFSTRHRFSDWPNVAIPAVAARVYVILAAGRTGLA
jgi:hypothetical protein